MDFRENLDDVCKMQRYHSHHILFVIQNLRNYSFMNWHIILIYIHIPWIGQGMIFLMIFIILVGKHQISKGLVNELWILFLVMLQRINMRTLQNHLYSIFFIMLLLLIGHLEVSQFVRNIFSLQILYFLVGIFSVQIFLLVECYHMFGIQPR